MVGKSGQFGKVIAGKLTIWREILTFEIKKYIRNCGKCDYLAGKKYTFSGRAPFPNLPYIKYSILDNLTLWPTFLKIWNLLDFLSTIFRIKQSVRLKMSVQGGIYPWKKVWWNLKFEIWKVYIYSLEIYQPACDLRAQPSTARLQFNFCVICDIYVSGTLTIFGICVKHLWIC